MALCSWQCCIESAGQDAVSVSHSAHTAVTHRTPAGVRWHAARGADAPGRARAQMLCQNIMGLYSSPLRIVVAMSLLYTQLGAASLVALGTLILFMPIQARPSSRLLQKGKSGEGLG